jgi:hypothetical protein
MSKDYRRSTDASGWNAWGRFVADVHAQGEYQWKVGDVFTDGTHRWRVDSIHSDGKAVLRSCSSSWATTIPLTFIEWREGGRWQLEA